MTRNLLKTRTIQGTSTGSETKNKEIGDLQKINCMVSRVSSKSLFDSFKILLSHRIPFISTQQQNCNFKKNQKKIAGPVFKWPQCCSEQDCGEVGRTSEPGENSSTVIAAPELTFAYKLSQLPAAQSDKKVQGTDYKAATLPSLTRF